MAGEGIRSVSDLTAITSAGSHFIRQVDDTIDIMSQDTIPFLKLIGVNGEAMTSSRYEWMSDELLKETVIMGATSNTSSASLTFATTLEDTPTANVQIGSILYVSSTTGNPSDGLQMLVTAIDSATAVTVTRPYAGTTDFWIGANTPIAGLASGAVRIIGLASVDTNDSARKEMVVPTFAYNVPQIFDSSFKITWLAKNTPQYGVANDESYQLEKTMKEIWVKLEQQAIFGKRYETDPKSFGGFDNFLSTNTTNNAGAALTESQLLDTLQSLWYSVGQDNMAKTILCGGWVKRKINSWFSPMAQMRRSERKGGVVVNEIDTDFGTVDVYIMNRIPANTLYILNPKFIKVHPFKGLNFKQYELPAAGAQDVNMVYGVYTLSLRNEQSMAKIYNISVTS